MPRGMISVGLLLLLGRSPAVVYAPVAAPVRETKETRAGVLVEGSVSKETAADDYKQLRAEALANAEVRVTARRKNPRVSSRGLDPGVLGTLAQQQAYLASHPLRSDLAATESTKASGKTASSSFPKARSVPAVPSKQLLSSFACNGPMIRSVNGARDGAIFTPQAPGNAYTIEGCSFGSKRGRIQLEPRSAAPAQAISPIVLQLDRSPTAWDDREIKVHLDPHLSGVPDSLVTLVIYAGNGQRMELPGCYFVAARGEPQLLTVIPASWVRLQATTVRSHSIHQLEYVSPPVGRDVPQDAAGASALVVRSDSEPFAAGSDTYDFSQLGPGWAVESVQLQTYAISCPADITYAQSFGQWDLAWDRTSFTISWKGDVCRSYVLPFLSFNLSFSQYAAKVWVVGPVGTQPVPGRTSEMNANGSS
jgi:hypothetical protein